MSEITTQVLTHRLTYGNGLPAMLHFGPNVDHDNGQDGGAFYTTDQVQILLANHDASLCPQCVAEAPAVESWTIAVTYQSGAVAVTMCTALYLLGQAIAEVTSRDLGQGPIKAIVIA